MKNPSDHILEPDTIRYASNTADLPSLDDQDTFFQAKLFPHRSMSPKTAQTVIAVIGILCIFAGLRFIIAGAWPVVLFVFCDVIALALAFYFNFRSARLYETIHLTKRSLIICRIHPNRQVETWSLEPYWLRTHIEKNNENDAFQIISHGKKLEIANFLIPHEKRDLKKALDRALHQWKHQEFET